MFFAAQGRQQDAEAEESDGLCSVSLQTEGGLLQADRRGVDLDAEELIGFHA